MAPRSDMDTAVLHPPPANTADVPRATLRQRFEQLQDPSVALAILRSYVPSDPARVEAVCTPQQSCHGHDGRDGPFVVRVDTITTTGEREAFAFKGYPDDCGQRMMHFFHTMATCPQCPPDTCPVSRPLAYIPQERLLISRWAPGQTVWAHLERGDIASLERVPSVLAQLYQAEARPKAATAQTLLERKVLRYREKALKRWPGAPDPLKPLMAALQEALPLLEPTRRVPVHGNLKPEHCFWNGRHMTLIDLDGFRYTDPAYDAGRFLGTLHWKCLHHPALMARAPELLATFRAAFLRAVPTASARNIAFYYALTLARLIYVDLDHLYVPAEWPRIVERYAHYAMSALRTGV